MTDIQHVNLIPAADEKDSVLVLMATVENFPNLHIQEFALRRERAAFREISNEPIV